MLVDPIIGPQLSGYVFEVPVQDFQFVNPRAWALDLENGLLLRDPWRKLVAQHEAEWQSLRRHATRVSHYRDLPGARSYPPEVRKLLRRMRRVRLDRLVNQLL